MFRSLRNIILSLSQISGSVAHDAMAARRSSILEAYKLPNRSVLASEPFLPDSVLGPQASSLLQRGQDPLTKASKLIMQACKPRYPPPSRFPYRGRGARRASFTPVSASGRFRFPSQPAAVRNFPQARGAIQPRRGARSQSSKRSSSTPTTQAKKQRF